MARLALLTTSLLSTLALAFSDGLLDARQGTACSARGQALSRCLGSAGTAFCSALLAQTTIAAKYVATVLGHSRAMLTLSQHHNNNDSDQCSWDFDHHSISGGYHHRQWVGQKNVLHVTLKAANANSVASLP